MRVFDREKSKYWFDVADAEVMNYINSAFSTYWLHDRDDYHTYYIETWDGTNHMVYMMEAGGWFGVGDDGPYDDRSYAPISDFKPDSDEVRYRLTKLKPDKDYLIL